ncbi:MAG TPA: hypothetical protein EYP68_01920 [Candidatus Korarchaeota archaeon]|nr:hypothetical protein [Candidatus Korarchaeota archaeon]
MVRFNGLLVAFSVVSGILLTTTIALQRESLYLALLLGSRIVRIGLILVLIVLLDIGVLGAILSIIASYVMICFLALPWTFSHVKPMKLSVTDFLSTLRGLISFGLPAAMQVMMFGISQEIPLVFLASVGSNIENAILRAASTYFIIVAGIVNAFGRAMIPRLGEDMPESSRRAIVLRSMPFFSLISAGMGSLLMGLPKTFMGLLSPELSIGMNVLRIMGFTMFLTSVTPLSSLAMIYGRKELLTIGISSIMVSSFLSYLLRNMGPNYLSLSYIGSYSVLSVSLLVLAKRMGLSLKETKRGVLGSISSGIITALTLSAVDILIENLILRLFIGLMLFSLVFPLTVVLFSKIKPDQMMRIIEILPLPRSLVQMLRKYLSTLFRLAHI